LYPAVDRTNSHIETDDFDMHFDMQNITCHNNVYMVSMTPESIDRAQKSGPGPVTTHLL